MNFVRNAVATRGTGRSGPFRILLALAAVLAPAMSIAGWEFQSPRPTPYGGFSAVFADANTGVASGEGGLVMTTSDGGATWIPRESGLSPLYKLFKVHFLDSTHVIAVGGFASLTGEVGSSIVQSSDAGATWTIPGAELSGIFFSDAYFHDTQKGIAVGVNYATVQPTISRTTDGGATWNTDSLEYFGLLTAIAFPKPQIGYAVGFDGNASNALMLRTSDGGDTWAPMSIASDQWLNDIKFASPDIGVAVGNLGTLFTTSNGGATWEPRTTGTTVDLHGVAFYGTSTIIATGGDYAEQGIILISTNGGDTWSSQTFDHSIEGAGFSSANVGTAVGSLGELLYTDDGGQSWRRQQESLSPDGLFGVAFVDEQTGTAVGGAGTILHTKDGGQTWRAQTSGTGLWLYGIAMADENNMMAVGGDFISFDRVIVGTTDGGGTWTDHTPPDLLVPMLGVACQAAGVCTAVGMCGKIVHTENGGADWTTQREADCQNQLALEGVYFFDHENGIAVGLGTILRTSNGGTTWVYQQPPTDQPLHGVMFADAHNGFIAAGQEENVGTILHSPDGGATWEVQRDDLPTPVQSVAFANANDGVAVTLGGEIYRTYDGGTTWALDKQTLTNLYGAVHKGNATAIVVGFSNYNATILGSSDRVFANGFDPN